MAIHEHTVGHVLKVMPQIFNIDIIYSKFTVTAKAVSVCYVNTVLCFKTKGEVFKAKQST